MWSNEHHISVVYDDVWGLLPQKELPKSSIQRALTSELYCHRFQFHCGRFWWDKTGHSCKSKFLLFDYDLELASSIAINSKEPNTCTFQHFELSTSLYCCTGIVDHVITHIIFWNEKKNHVVKSKESINKGAIKGAIFFLIFKKGKKHASNLFELIPVNLELRAVIKVTLIFIILTWHFNTITVNLFPQQHNISPHPHTQTEH